MRNSNWESFHQLVLLNWRLQLSTTIVSTAPKHVLRKGFSRDTRILDDDSIVLDCQKRLAASNCLSKDIRMLLIGSEPGSISQKLRHHRLLKESSSSSSRSWSHWTISFVTLIVEVTTGLSSMSLPM
ncbi:unnamed protein product [Caenorhabditis brenneri]